MALRRMMAWRGQPKSIYSDNGTNFKGSKNEKRRQILSMDNEKQKQFAAENKIEWLFNPFDAPNMGGSLERLIRSVKVALVAVLKQEASRDEALVTLFAEGKHCVNSRPLTHVSVVPNR